MNLVGHVAVALGDEEAPSDEFLVGCLLPDLSAIARVRLARPSGELGRGVAYHHACDAAFHESAWFRARNLELRDELLTSGVDTGAARACSHAGLEMVLDGVLIGDDLVEARMRGAFAAVHASADELAALAPEGSRSECITRFRTIVRSLDPRGYADARFVAERLQRMTAGRRRIELRADHVDTVAAALAARQPAVAADAAGVLAGVRCSVSGAPVVSAPAPR